MMETIEVDMDGEWKSAFGPSHGLVTSGVATCIAIAVADDEGKEAWLIHSPVFGHDVSKLEEMLDRAKAAHPNGKGLKVLVIGGDLPDEEVEETVKCARKAVRETVIAMLPEATLNVRWGGVSQAELFFAEDAWRFQGMIRGILDW